MKRMALIAVALCALLLTTVGTAAAVQKGKSPIYQFAVTGVGCDGAGKLVINLDEQKFVFNGKGFESGKSYRLWYVIGSTNGLPEPIYPLDASVANAAGNVHIEGVWTEAAVGSWPAPAFTIKPNSAMMSGPLHAVLHNTGGPLLAGPDAGTWQLDALQSTGDIVKYKFEYWDNGVYHLVYEGTSPRLNDRSEPYRDVTVMLSGHVYSWLLTVYDSAGNSAQTNLFAVLHDQGGPVGPDGGGFVYDALQSTGDIVKYKLEWWDNGAYTLVYQGTNPRLNDQGYPGAPVFVMFSGHTYDILLTIYDSAGNSAQTP